jgi:nifR3 family TIM-barrel protein
MTREKGKVKNRALNTGSKTSNIGSKKGLIVENIPINKGFWADIKKPFFVLAPMANVTDFAFRTLFAKYGKPDVVWTEFVSADGLVSKGREILLNDLKFSKKEKPIVAQLFTGHKNAMEQACALVADLGFDGIDINMGCPDKAVLKQGGGASLIQNPKLALEILESARRGVMLSFDNTHKKIVDDKKPKNNGNNKIPIPVSVKTRIGYNTIDLNWIEFLLEQKLPVLTVHLRTKKEMSEVPAHWDIMPQIIQIRDEVSPETLIIGNGDVETLEQATLYIQKYGCDGVMIGRGIFGKPWFFAQKEEYKKAFNDSHNITSVKIKEFSIQEKLSILLEHARLFNKNFADLKSFAVMKKHFKAYVSGWDGAKELRVKLMEVENVRQLSKIIKDYLA